MCIHARIHVYTYIHIHIRTCTYIHTYIHTCIHKCIYTLVLDARAFQQIPRFEGSSTRGMRTTTPWPHAAARLLSVSSGNGHKDPDTIPIIYNLRIKAHTSNATKTGKKQIGPQRSHPIFCSQAHYQGVPETLVCRMRMSTWTWAPRRK